MAGHPKKKAIKEQSPPIVSPSRIHNFAEWIMSFFAIGIVAITAVSRVFLSANPLNRDEGTYGYLGQLAIKGMTPYVDFYEMKPPMLYYFYGLGGSLFGFTDLGLRLFALALNLASCLLLYLFLQRYVSKTYALISAALFSMLTLNLFAFGFTMVAEHMVNTLMLLSLFFLHRHKDSRRVYLVLLAGATFSLAIFTKQTAILLSPVFLIYFLTDRKNHPWLLQCTRFAAGVLIPVVLFLVVFMINGGLTEARYWLVTYPSQYSSALSMEEGKVMFTYFLQNISFFQVTLFILTPVALLATIAWGRKKLNGLLLVYFLFAVLSIFPGLRFYGQYWQLVFIPMAMMTGSALSQLDLRYKRAGLMAGWIVLICMGIEFGIHREYYFFKGDSPGIEKLYKNNPFEAIREMATYAGRLMKSEDTFMVFGSEPQAYLYAEKMAPSKHIFMSMISKTDETSVKFIQETINDLQTHEPTYLLMNIFPFSWGFKETSNTSLYTSAFNYAQQYYTPVAAYQMADKSFLYADKADPIDPAQANQIILYKRK